MQEINVLGQAYELILDTPENNPKLKNNYGYLEQFSKKIVIDNTITNSNDLESAEKLELFVNKVYRHEIIHAFFHESGISHNYSKAEEEFIVDWIAVQFPKLLKLFEQLDVLG